MSLGHTLTEHIVDEFKYEDKWVNCEECTCMYYNAVA